MLCLPKVALCAETDDCRKFTGVFSNLVPLFPTDKSRTGEDEGKTFTCSWICHVDAGAESLIKVFGLFLKIIFQERECYFE